ncbi:conserved hypothetical protein [Vibrio owensii]|uniref:Phage tail protein n=1 Tax=Vibrio owensii TaxID=696485 RepID=A0AAU9PZ42_9VIBR|nr:conserved hypothetical protein [Vibrio owensii]
MSNTLVFDYAVDIQEAQTATEADYSFLYRCLVMVSGNYVAPPPEEVQAQTAKAKTAQSQTKKIEKTIIAKNLKTVKMTVPVVNQETGAVVKQGDEVVMETADFTDPSQYKVVPIYDPTTIANYTDNAEVPRFFVGGLEKVYLLMLASEVDPDETEAIDFDPTDYLTLCFSTDVDITTAESINFADFTGVRVYANGDKAKVEELSATDTAFLDDNSAYSGAFEQIGNLLSKVYWRNCQYNVLEGTNPTTTIKTVGEGNDLFNKRVSFFLNGADGPTLGFFGNAGNAITKKYIWHLIRLEVQQAITAYIQTNEPNNTAVQRINIEEEAMSVIEKYEGEPYFYLDSDKNNYVSIFKSNEQYVVYGKSELKDAEPIWLTKIEVVEAQ